MYASSQHAASFHCLVKEWKDCEELKPKQKETLIFVDTKSEGTKHRTEWCAEPNTYRCMRCGSGSKYMKMPGKCTGPKYLSENSNKNRESDILEPRFGKENGQTGWSSDLVQKMLGFYEAENGTKVDERLQARASRH